MRSAAAGMTRPLRLMKHGNTRRRIELNLPIVPGSTLSRRRFLLSSGAFLAGPGVLAACGATSVSASGPPPAKSCRVHILLVDAQTGKTTPAMVCITNAAAGSDTPWGSTIGEVRTYVHAGEVFDVDAWFRSFKAGHTFVSNGPALEFTVDGELPGTELKRSAGERVKIKARALGHASIGLPTALRVEGPGGVVKEIKADQGETDLAFEMEYGIERSQWLMASAVCHNQAVANTTPVYIVVNDQPTWDPRQGPRIIQGQLAAITKIETEFASGDDTRSAGIRERLRKARAFYNGLRDRMSRAA